jgi:hypothetical protein
MSTCSDCYKININSTLNEGEGVRDQSSDMSAANYLDNDKNPKKSLPVNGKCYKPTITVVPGGEIPTTGGGKINIGGKIKPQGGDKENPIVKEVLDKGNGTIIIVDPGSDVDVGILGRTKIQAIILDAVGNMVVKTDDTGKSEHLCVFVSTIEGSAKNVLTITWDNKNSIGRDVGAGVYVLIMESEFEGRTDKFQFREMLPVPQKKTKVEK